MIEALVMIAAGIAILYWAFRVSHRDAESRRDPATRKGADEV